MSREEAAHPWLDKVRNALLYGGELARNFVTLLSVLRSPIAVSTLIAVALCAPAQTREIYRSLAESPHDSPSVIFFVAISVTALSLLLYLVSSMVLASLNDAPLTVFRTGFIALMSSLPLGGLVIGLLLAQLGGVAADNQAIDHNLRWGAVATLLFGLVASKTAVFFATRCPQIGKQLVALFSRPVFGIISLALVAGSTAAVYFGGAILAPVIGAIAILAWFAAILLIASGHLGLMYNRYGYPLLSLLLISAMVFSVLGWNRNHQIRTLQNTGPAPLGDFDQSFKEWLRLREDLEYYQNGNLPYPVFVISAEGGGIYAAYHAAMLLARIQDSCPRFAQHTFAISGVSGGSLGGALFSALATRFALNSRDLACGSLTADAEILQKQTRSFFESDLLSPLLASTLFLDFMQRFLPITINGFDRARALEYGIENAWSRTSSDEMRDQFRSSFRQLWKTQGAAPALLLNTTQTHNGRREIIAPFIVNFKIAPQTLAYLGAKVDIPLSTAVALSARFPWLTSAGTYQTEHDELQLGDGGYFENSGTETAHNLIWELVRSNTAASAPAAAISNKATLEVKNVKLQIEFILISIRAENLPRPPSIAGEVMAPIQTLLNTRQERGVLSWRQAFRSLCLGCSLETLSLQDTVFAHLLNMRGNRFPLGWYLSQNSQQKISELLGNASQCPLRNGGTVRRSEIDRAGDCIFAAVSGYLQRPPAALPLPNRGVQHGN